MQIISYHLKLQEMFSELADAKPVSETSSASYNDGGTTYNTLWKGPNGHYLSSFNDLAIEHPDTFIQAVERYLHKEWRVKLLGKAKKFGKT